jgi:hypothetical protein
MKMFRAGGSKARQIKTIAALTMAVLALSAFAPDAMAQATGSGGSMSIPTSGKSIGTIAGNITTSIRGAGVMVTALAYLGALAFGFMGALKWKAYGEQPDRTPLKVPVTYMAIAAILAALPEFLGTGISTIWGSNATVVQQP